MDTSLWDMVMLTLVDYSSADLQDFADGLQVELKQLKSRMQAEAAPARVTAEKVKARKKDFPNLIDASRGSTSHHASQSRSFSPSVKV